MRNKRKLVDCESVVQSSRHQLVDRRSGPEAQGELMGRVYEALRRAGVDQSPIPLRRVSHQFSTGAEEDFTRRVHRYVPASQQIEAELFRISIRDQAEHSVKKFSVHCAHCVRIRWDGTPQRICVS